MFGAWLRLAAVLALSVMPSWTAGCGDDDDDGPDAPDLRDGAVTGDAGTREDGGDEDVPCAAADDGESCGSGKYCVHGVCALNICGDGVKAGGEACDDGNQRTGDGCDPACRAESTSCGDAIVNDDAEECDDGNWIDTDECTNACLINVCGNGRIDDREECDDGNTLDTDGCSNECQVVQCRNGRIEPGEQCDDGNGTNDDECTNACVAVHCGNGKVEGWEYCDDGNTVDADECPNNCLVGAICGNGVVEASEECEGPHEAFPLTGDRSNPACGLPSSIPEHEEESWSCADDCTLLPHDDCETCRDEWCRDVLGVDAVKGCLEQVNSDFGLGMADECAVQQCADAVNCALANRCSLVDPSQEEIPCYCGASTDVSTCQGTGPGPDASCVAEWQNAARSTDNSLVFGRFQDLSYPSAWAHYVLVCYSTHCEHECMGSPSCDSDSDCGSGEVCCATGTVDDVRYHNFKCIAGSECPKVDVRRPTVDCSAESGCPSDAQLNSYETGRLRRACTQNTDCPDAQPYCKSKRDSTSEAVAPFVLLPDKKVCDATP